MPMNIKAQMFQLDLLSQGIMLSFLLLSLSTVLLAHPFPLHSRHGGHNNSTFGDPVPSALPAPTHVSNFSCNCFPSIGFEMPSNVPNSTEDWWCNPATEYAFVGFSYEVTACACILFYLNKLYRINYSVRRSEPTATKK